MVKGPGLKVAGKPQSGIIKGAACVNYGATVLEFGALFEPSKKERDVWIRNKR